MKTIQIVKETILHGFDQLPAALLGLFTGENEGKMIVQTIKDSVPG